MLFSDRAHWPKLKIVHCGVDPARYDASGPRDGHHLAFVGRLDAVKGVPLLLEALAEARKSLPDLRLTLVGDGPDREALLDQARALDLSEAVEFAGYLSQTEVAALLAYADCLVLPSFAEGVPVVLMEAMAARVPVVTTRIAGVPELVEDGVSGLLVPPGDVHALQAAIERLLYDKHLCRDVGEAGRLRVEVEFASDHEAAWLAALFAGYSAGVPPKSLRPKATT